jgi:hypothetical protein
MICQRLPRRVALGDKTIVYTIHFHADCFNLTRHNPSGVLRMVLVAQNMTR